MHLPSLLAAVLAAGSLPCAQLLTVAPGPHAPGVVVPVQITNDTASAVFFADGCGVRVVRAGTGEYMGSPYVWPQACDAFHVVSPGQSLQQFLVTPSRAGSYVAVFAAGGHAVAPFDVVAPTLPTPTLHAFPAALMLPQRLHQVDFASPASTPFDLGNTGAVDHVFAPGERLVLTAPGGIAPLATLDLGGLVVPAGKVTQVALPLAGLTPGPYSVRIDWNDPGTGAPLVARHGVHVLGSRLDLHLPGGHVLAPGAPVTVTVACQGFPGTAGLEPTGVVLLSFLPGTTTLPDGTVAPVVQDGLLDLSLGGLGGLLVNHVQVIQNLFTPGGFFGHAGTMTGVELHHPGIPGLAGLEVRMAAIGLDPPQLEFGASQAETIVLQ